MIIKNGNLYQIYFPLTKFAMVKAAIETHAKQIESYSNGIDILITTYKYNDKAFRVTVEEENEAVYIESEDVMALKDLEPLIQAI